MRSASVILLLTGLAIVVAAALAENGFAVFIDQDNITANAFDTDNCFPNNNTGFLDPSAEAADTGGNGDGFDVNPTNAFTDGGSDPNYSAVNFFGPGDRHRYHNYGVSIDVSCVISGIEVRLDWWTLSTLDTNSMDVELSWNGGTSWTAAKTDSVESSSEHTTTLGGFTDTWGHAWTVAELSNTNFRVRLTSNCVNTFPAFCALQIFFLDWVPVKVYYGP